MKTKTLDLKYLTPVLAVSPQLFPSDMLQVAEAGFKSIIINLPDFELSHEQPTAQMIIEAANQVGVAATYQPVCAPNITQADCDNFKALLNTLEKPILAFCRTGNRSGLLFTGKSTS